MQIRYLKKFLQEAKKLSTASLRKLYTVADSSTFLQVVVIFFFSEKGWDKIQIEIVLDHTFINLTV